ncbi:MAG: hypothetical protein Q7J23_07810, partial [Nitrosomonas sp.]|nr:hypothetical protein [Nitrosomonas sp.]
FTTGSDYIQLMDIYRPLTSSCCKMLFNLVSRKVLTHHTPPATKGRAIAINQKNSSTRTSIDELIEITVEDLLKRNTSKPRTPKTLMSTIHAKFGKNTLAVDIEAVYKGLMSRGYVKVNGTKVSYELPATT